MKDGRCTPWQSLYVSYVWVCKLTVLFAGSTPYRNGLIQTLHDQHLCTIYFNINSQIIGHTIPNQNPILLPGSFADIAEDSAEIALFGKSISTKQRVCFEILPRR